MLSIKRVEKVKVESFSADLQQKAQEKCQEGARYLNRALFEKSNQFLFKAIESFEEAIKTYSRMIEPYLALAFICLNLEKITEAQKFVSKVLEIEPGNIKAKNLWKKIIAEKKKLSISKIVNDYSLSKEKQKVRLNSETILRINQAFTRKK